MDASSLSARGCNSGLSQDLNDHHDLAHGSRYHLKRDEGGTPAMISRYLAEPDGLDALVRRDQKDEREKRMRSYVDEWERHWEKLSGTNTRSSKSSEP